MKKEDYRKEIIKIVSKLHNESFLKMIYGFVKGFYKQEKAEK